MGSCGVFSGRGMWEGHVGGACGRGSYGRGMWEGVFWEGHVGGVLMGGACGRGSSGRGMWEGFLWEVHVKSRFHYSLYCFLVPRAML